MFSGMYNNSVDAKGRVVLPAKFRDELGSEFYFAKGFGNCCIQVMSAEQFKAISAKILELPADKALILQYTFSASAVEASANAQGRVLVPQSLREFAQIEDNAVIIGMDNRVEIWNKSKYEEYISEHQADLAQAISMLKF